VNPLHVAVLTPGFAGDEAETNCIPALQDLLLSLPKYAPEIDLTILTLRYPHRTKPYTWHGINVFPTNGQQLRFPKIVPTWIHFVGNFARTNARKPVHLIHSFWLSECAMLGELLSRFYRIPHVVTLMGREVEGPNRYRGLLKSRRTIFVAVSQLHRRHVLERCGSDVHYVIPWGLPECARNEGGARDIDVLGVGSLTEVKDFDTFLDVVSLVRKDRPALTCHIAGDGPNRVHLEAKVHDLGLVDSVHFEGWVSRERVLELMRRSRILLHSSRFESFGLVFLEALACGAMIVSREVGIAESSPSWSVANDPEEMATAVVRFLNSALPPKVVIKSIETSAKTYVDLYRQMRAGVRL
jgi:glycosyltransferase involved in cell wall biosynthesis